jgi:histidinol-phosphate aminotransferase
MFGDGGAFFKALQRRGIIVRPLAPYGMAEFVRITIGTVNENERLLEATREIAQNSEASA